MRYKNAILMATFTVFLLLPLVPQTAASEDKVEFSWGFFLKTAEGQVKSLSFAGQEPVVSGDFLRVYLELRESSFVYMFLYDSRGDLYQVFPPSPDFYQHSFPAWQRYYIPSSREWFALDESEGLERFFVLASNKRLKDLEELSKAVIFDRNGGVDFKQAAEIIEKKVLALSNTQSAKIDPVNVTHTVKLSSLIQGDSISVNRITSSGPYGQVLELVNR